jgi:DNA-binding transcriptional LysR family regulator
MVRRLERFENRYPQIDLILQEGSCRRLANAIRQRDLDIAFMCGIGDMRSCQNETIGEEGMAALLPANHFLAGKAEMTWSDLVGERLLVPQSADGPLLYPCQMPPDRRKRPRACHRLVPGLPSNRHSQGADRQGFHDHRQELRQGRQHRRKRLAADHRYHRYHRGRQGCLARIQSQVRRTAPCRHGTKHGREGEPNIGWRRPPTR